MKEKDWEKRLRNDAKSLNVEFSMELHQKVMKNLFLEKPVPTTTRRKRFSSLIRSMSVATLVLLGVFLGNRSFKAPESEPTPTHPSEVAKFFAPCGEPLRAVVETTGITLRPSEEASLPLPEKEQLKNLWNDTQNFLDEQVAWIVE